MALRIHFLMFPSMLVILVAVAVLDGLLFQHLLLFWSAGFHLFSDLWLIFEDFPENSLVNLTLVGSEGHRKVNLQFWTWMDDFVEPWMSHVMYANSTSYQKDYSRRSWFYPGNIGLSYLTDETLALSLKSLSMVTWSWVWTWTTFELDPVWPKTRLKNPVFFFAILSIFFIWHRFFSQLENIESDLENKMVRSSLSHLNLFDFLAYRF